MATRITETHLASSVDPARYRRELIALMNSVGSLKGEGIQTTLDLFQDLRRQTIDILAFSTEESAPLYRQTVNQIDQAIADFGRRYSVATQDLLSRGFDLGEEIAIGPVAAAAGRPELLTIGRGLSQNQLEIIQGFSTDLVAGLTVDLRKRINSEVAGIFAGVQTPFQAAEKIGRNLTSRNHFSTMFARARTIVVTEIGRAQAVATQRSQEALTETLTNAGDDTVVRKRWLNAHLPGARATHLAAERRYSPGGVPGPIPIDENYTVAGELGLYPRDPSFSVGNSANCHCVSITVLDDIDPVGEGEQRRRLDKAIAKPAEPGPLPPADGREPWERENEERMERLRDPLPLPDRWAKMGKQKKLDWLEERMEADFPRSGPPKIRTHTIRMTTRQRRAFAKKNGRFPDRTEQVLGHLDIDTNITTFDLKGTSPEVMVSHLNRLRELASKYPEVATRLRFFGTYQADKGAFYRARLGTAGSQFSGAIAHASHDGARIGINSHYYRSSKDIIDKTRSLADWQARTGFDSGFKSTNELTRSVVHEWGHQVDNWLRRTDRAGLVDDALGGFDRRMTFISDYAAKSKGENFAELFAAAEAPAGVDISTRGAPALARIKTLLASLIGSSP